MKERRSPEDAARRVEEALDRISDRNHPIANILQAFRCVFAPKARFKAELSEMEVPFVPPLDPSRFSQGATLARPEDFIGAIHSWQGAVASLMPALENGFPGIVEEIRNIRAALADGRLSSASCGEVVLDRQGCKSAEIAAGIHAKPEVLQFVLSQLAKPYVEKQAESLRPVVEDLSWYRGYCPLCGSRPELSFLQGEAGERWLRCSFCAHEWRFMRSACPYCESEEQGNMELTYVEGREGERVELCRRCRKYVLNIDLRNRPEEVVLEVAALTMVHLDMLAQKEGFSPMAVCAWNTL